MEIKEVFKNPEQLDFVKWMRIVDKEINNQSDRALVLLCASILDKQLEDILKEFLIEDKRREENIFGSNSLFSTFSDKLNACYYMGLISKHEHSCINTIRKIRNKFAHEIMINSFEDNQALSDLCNNLSIPLGMYVPDTLVFNNDGIKDFPDNPFTKETLPKERFIKTFKYLTLYLYIRCYEISDSKRKEFVPKTQYQLLFDIRKTVMDLNKKHTALLEKAVERLEELKSLLEKKGEPFGDNYQAKLDNYKKEICKLKSNPYASFNDELTISPDKFQIHFDQVISALNRSDD